MMKIDNGTINFSVYEGANEFLGMAEATLPEISMIAEEIKGAGIAGSFSGPYAGHFEPMSLTLNFRSTTRAAVQLLKPEAHQIELRVAQQKWDNNSGKNIVESVKHVVVATPLKYAPGKLASASPTDGSGEYSVSYYAMFIDGQKVIEIDIINFICYINGEDYLADVRTALGK